MSAAEPTLLLAEPDALMRSTLAGVARELRLARLHEASSHAAAMDMLQSRRYEGLLVAVDAGNGGIELIEALRNGDTPNDAAAPVAVLAATCSAEGVQQLQALKVQRIVLKPFKVRTVIETVSQMVGRPVA